jgi:hypothetical protein
MTVFQGNPNVLPHRRKSVAEKVSAPAGDKEGEGKGWKDAPSPKERAAARKAEAEASKAEPKLIGVIFSEETAPLDLEPVKAKGKAKAKAEPKAKADPLEKQYADELAKNKKAQAKKPKAKPADDQPTDKKPKAKAKAEPKAKPKAKAKAEPKAKKPAKAKAPVDPKPEKVKAPKRSKGRRPPPEPVDGKVTKILLRLTAKDARDIDAHRGELTRPGYIHHLMRVGIASKGRRATD